MIKRVFYSAFPALVIGCTHFYLKSPKFTFKYTHGYIFNYLRAQLPLFTDATTRRNLEVYRYAFETRVEPILITSITIAGFSMAAIFVLLSMFFYHRGKAEMRDIWKKGSRLLSVKQSNKAIKAQYKKEKPFEMGQPLFLGDQGLVIPESLLFRHFRFQGASGGGKTTALHEVLLQLRARGSKVIILDNKGEFYAKHGRPTDHVLSLLDDRSDYWDFWQELGDVTPDRIAAALIQAGSDHNDFFWKGPRAVLASLIRKNTSMHGLWHDFQKPIATIREELSERREISRRVLGENDGDQADGIMGSTVLDLSFLRYLNAWTKGKKPLSISKWMMDNDDLSWIFIPYNDDDIEVIQPLLRLWVDIAVGTGLKRDDEDPNLVHTWIIIDELSSVGKLPSLPGLLAKGRKPKVTLSVGYQADSQIEQLHGPQETKTIQQGLQNKILFTMTEDEPAEAASRLCGEMDVLQAVDGMTFSANETVNGKGTISRQLVTKRVITPDHFKRLLPFECVAQLSYHNPVQLKLRKLKLPTVNGKAQSKWPPYEYEPEPPAGYNPPPPTPAPVQGQTQGMKREIDPELVAIVAKVRAEQRLESYANAVSFLRRMDLSGQDLRQVPHHYLRFWTFDKEEAVPETLPEMWKTAFLNIPGLVLQGSVDEIRKHLVATLKSAKQAPQKPHEGEAVRSVQPDAKAAPVPTAAPSVQKQSTPKPVPQTLLDLIPSEEE